MGGICTSIKDNLDIEKQAKAFSSAIRDAEQNRRYQQCLHEKEQARLQKRKATDKEAKRVLREERDNDARNALISDDDAPKTGRRTSRDHPDTKSRKTSGDVSSRRQSHSNDYDSSVASKKATSRHSNDDDFGRTRSNPRSHTPRRASVGYDGDPGQGEEFRSRRNGFASLDDRRRHSGDDHQHHSHHHSHHKDRGKEPKAVVTTSTTKGTIISTRRGAPPERLRRSSTATLQGRGEGDEKGSDEEVHDRKLVRKASSFTLQNTHNNTNGLLGALGMDFSFRRNSIHKKVTGKELAWLGQMDTMFDNDRDPKKSEELKALDRQIHSATAGFFHSM